MKNFRLGIRPILARLESAELLSRSLPHKTKIAEENTIIQITS
jgi:hypothetical protein